MHTVRPAPRGQPSDPRDGRGTRIAPQLSRTVHVGDMAPKKMRRLLADFPPGMLPLYDEDDVAALLGISVRLLQAWRSEGRDGPSFVRVGGKVRYSHRDVIAFVEARTVRRVG